MFYPQENKILFLHYASSNYHLLCQSLVDILSTVQVHLLSTFCHLQFRLRGMTQKLMRRTMWKSEYVTYISNIYLRHTLEILGVDNPPSISHALLISQLKGVHCIEIQCIITTALADVDNIVESN